MTNLGPNSRKLRDGEGDFVGVRQLAADFRKVNGLASETLVPIDAVTRSGSGLDPHISPANAELQIARLARQRQLNEDIVRKFVAAHTHGPQIGFMGEPRVNVLSLNLALDVGQVPSATPSLRIPASVRKWLEYALFLLNVLLLARPVGAYLAKVFEGKPTTIDPVLKPIGQLLYLLTGVHGNSEMTAVGYAFAFVTFSLFGTGFLLALLLQ